MSGAKSRNKGAAFEREIAKLIEDATGIKPKRNLEQYRQQDQGDLMGIEGWTIECKIRKDGVWPEEKWWDQVVKAAACINSKPALIYRQNRQPVRVMLRTWVFTLNGGKIGIPIVMNFEQWLTILKDEAARRLLPTGDTGPEESAS